VPADTAEGVLNAPAGCGRKDLRAKAAPAQRRLLRIPRATAESTDVAADQLAVAIHADDELLRGRIASVLQADGILTAPSSGDHGNGRGADVAVMFRDLARIQRRAELRLALEEAGELPVVIVSTAANAYSSRRALAAGAMGLVFYEEIGTALAPTVRAVAANQTCVPRALAKNPALSHREREVLKLVVSGRTNYEIATTLHLAESTVKSHLSSVFDRLGVRSRGEAARLVLDPEEGLRAIVLGTGVTTSSSAEAGSNSSNGA